MSTVKIKKENDNGFGKGKWARGQKEIKGAKT
jgi:hypothetical protein